MTALAPWLDSRERQPRTPSDLIRAATRRDPGRLAALAVAYVGTFGQALGGPRQFGGVMSKPWRMVALHVGAWITLALLLGGRPIDAAEAERWGLVNRAVADARLDGEVDEWIERFLSLPADALRLQKALLARWRRMDLDTAVALSVDTFVRAYATGEPQRAMQAFLDRRRA